MKAATSMLAFLLSTGPGALGLKAGFDQVVLKHVYKNLDKPPRRAQHKYEKYLGDMTSKMVVKTLEGLEVPPYLHSSHYVRTGAHKVLMPNDGYWEQYPDDSEAIFTHHLHLPYLQALGSANLGGGARPMALRKQLHDIWALERINGQDINKIVARSQPYLEL
jgi:hypothetical protein